MTRREQDHNFVIGSVEETSKELRKLSRLTRAFFLGSFGSSTRLTKCADELHEVAEELQRMSWEQRRKIKDKF